MVELGQTLAVEPELPEETATFAFTDIEGDFYLAQEGNSVSTRTPIRLPDLRADQRRTAVIVHGSKFS